MSTLDVLRVARATIAENWCQGSNPPGVVREPRVGEAANAPCAWLAIHRVSSGVTDSGAEQALLRVIGGDSENDIFRFNDSHTHAEVLAMFDRAVAVEEAKAAEFTAAPESAPLVAA